MALSTRRSVAAAAIGLIAVGAPLAAATANAADTPTPSASSSYTPGTSFNMPNVDVLLGGAKNLGTLDSTSYAVAFSGVRDGKVVDQKFTSFVEGGHSITDEFPDLNKGTWAVHNDCENDSPFITLKQDVKGVAARSADDEWAIKDASVLPAAWVPAGYATNGQIAMCATNSGWKIVNSSADVKGSTKPDSAFTKAATAGWINYDAATNTVNFNEGVLPAFQAAFDDAVKKAAATASATPSTTASPSSSLPSQTTEPGSKESTSSASSTASPTSSSTSSSASATSTASSTAAPSTSSATSSSSSTSATSSASATSSDDGGFTIVDPHLHSSGAPTPSSTSGSSSSGLGGLFGGSSTSTSRSTSTPSSSSSTSTSRGSSAEDMAPPTGDTGYTSGSSNDDGPKMQTDH